MQRLKSGTTERETLIGMVKSDLDSAQARQWIFLDTGVGRYAPYPWYTPSASCAELIDSEAVVQQRRKGRLVERERERESGTCAVHTA